MSTPLESGFAKLVASAIAVAADQLGDVLMVQLDDHVHSPLREIENQLSRIADQLELMNSRKD